MPGDPDTLRLPLAQLPDPLPIPTLPRGRAPFTARIRPPGSKSLTNRALLLAALADGDSTLRRPLLHADDAERMTAALAHLGSSFQTAGDALQVRGVGGRWRPAPGPEVSLNLHNAGTATRFLAAAALLSPVPVLIDGNPRMRERPIGELIDALAELGAAFDYVAAPRFPPVRIHPPTDLPRNATLTLATTLSSQFISALLLIAPWLPGGLTLRLEGEVTSPTYVHMTLGLLDHLGATVRTSDSLVVVRVAPPSGRAGLASFDYLVEPDASGATYFWAAAAIVPGAISRVEGLDSRSLQGDTRFPDLLARMGAAILRDDAAPNLNADSETDPAAHAPSIGVRGPGALAPIMADLSPMPDAAMTLAAVACFANGRSILRGLRTLRVKETDRIAALQAELAKVGVKVETNVLGDRDAITITPPPGGIPATPDAAPITFDTYDDHRMAMSLALIGLRRPNVLIRAPGCVAKTYPAFWRDFADLAG